MGKMRKRISFIESVIVSPVKNTFALNLVYFFSLKSKGRIKKIKGEGEEKKETYTSSFSLQTRITTCYINSNVVDRRGNVENIRGEKKQRYYGWIEASRGELTRDTETCTTSSKVDKLDELECKMI